MTQDAVSELLEQRDEIIEKINKLILEVVHHFENGHKELSSTWVIMKLEELK